jgi:hypothetical protein
MQVTIIFGMNKGDGTFQKNILHYLKLIATFVLWHHLPLSAGYSLRATMQPVCPQHPGYSPWSMFHFVYHAWVCSYIT